MRNSRWWQKVGQYDYDASGDEDAQSGEWDSQFDDAGYPGPIEHFVPDAANYPSPHGGVVTIKDFIDYEIGGLPGDTKMVYATGVVEPTNVDAHNLSGGMVVVRRMADTNYGPVATSDHNSLLSLLYAMQESTAFFPNETSQIDMVKSV